MNSGFRLEYAPELATGVFLVLLVEDEPLSKFSTGGGLQCSFLCCLHGLEVDALTVLQVHWQRKYCV